MGSNALGEFVVAVRVLGHYYHFFIAPCAVLLHILGQRGLVNFSNSEVFTLNIFYIKCYSTHSQQVSLSFSSLKLNLNVVKLLMTTYCTKYKAK